MTRILKQAKKIGTQSVIKKNLDRDVYCLLGLAIDAVDMESATVNVRLAASQNSPYLLSTPNVNFLINSQRNAEFRDAVLNSDLCVADGMPLIWIARLLGVPLPERVAGSDIFERLKSHDAGNSEALTVFFFGGEKGVGEKACKALNSQPGNVNCVGALDPGFATLEEMSSDKIISEINDSGADFLVVALGAVKGHVWLEHNKDRLRIPLRSHLGAVINFEAGRIARSPGIIGRLGFEWLWRIKEEPKLWRRYWSDGSALTALMFARVLPLVCWNLRMQYRAKKRQSDFSISSEEDAISAKVCISGYAGHDKITEIRKCLKLIESLGVDTLFDFRNLKFLSSSALGSLVILKKQLVLKNSGLEIVGASIEIRRLFKWQGLEFLLADDNRQ